MREILPGFASASLPFFGDRKDQGHSAANSKGLFELLSLAVSLPTR